MSDYPDAPGFKGTDGTSEAAADAIAPSVSRLRLLALRGLARRGAATPLEVVEARRGAQDGDDRRATAFFSAIALAATLIFWL